MEKILVELLQETKSKGNGNWALKSLRNSFGFDFCKPIKAVKFKDSFTPTSLKNLYGIDCKEMIVAVIFKRGAWFETAEYTDGVVNLIEGSIYPLSTICTKSDFNEWRKDGLFETYVIAQKRVFKLPRFRYRWQGVNSLEVGERYKPYNPDNFRSGVLKIDSAYIYEKHIDYDFDYEKFDKSGYPVYVKREELRKKVIAIREERQRDSYKAMTNTKDMINKAKQAIELKKIELSKRLLDCKTAHDVNIFGASLTRFSGLYGCYCDIEDIEEKDNEKRFKSPEAFNKAIANIYDTLARI